MAELIDSAPIHGILKAVGVQRVVAIDDTYADRAPVADAIAALNQVAPEVAASVLEDFTDVDFAGDPEIRDHIIRERWGTLPHQRRSQILEELLTKSSETADTDKVAKDSLGEIFGTLDFQALSLSEWNKRKGEILQDKSLTLLLIDEDFSKESASATQGLEVVKEILASTSATNVLCALLSHKYSPDNIHGQWEQLCDANGFDKSRFVLIPKTTIEADPSAFARLIKLAAIAKPIDTLRSMTTEIVVNAVAGAREDLNKIDIYDMDEIIFRSSWAEGVWEPETLLRVFSLYHRTRVRQLALSNDEIHRIAAEVRRVSQIATESASQPQHRIWPIQRLEIYEGAEYLNSLHLGTELGDIFERDGGKQYILIAPPCDLMVRSKGNRGESIKEATLAPLVTDISDERKSVCWELGYYAPAVKHYVDFKQAFSVRLLGLDFCVFNDGGVAALTVGQEPPKKLIPAWTARFGKLQEEITGIFGQIEEVRASGQDRRSLELALATIDHQRVFPPTFQYSPKTLRYNFKRIGRLLLPRSSALLTAFAQYLGHSVFDHYLERPRRQGSAELQN